MLLDDLAIDDLAIGAAFLGSGGGGDPYHTRILAKAELAKSGPVQLIRVEDLAPDALVAPCGWIGAPTVSMEKLPNGQEPILGLRKLEQILGRPIDAVLPIEIGGANGLAAVVAAAKFGVPVVDADGMGRAFPESQMTIFNIRGLSSCPAIITDAAGNVVTIESEDNLAHERIARAISVSMGGIAHMVEYPLTGQQARSHAICGSITAAIAIGAAIREAKQQGGDLFEAVFGALRRSNVYSSAGVLFDGKIIDLECETKHGFSMGRVLIQGFGNAGEMEIVFQNENLAARRNGELVACTPDIISIMDRETADIITTERLKYGQRVKVVAAAAPAILRDAKALSIVGPAAFGMEDRYIPVEELNNWEGKSV
ncbi:MAG: hypothetical protein COB36_12625 [Alphaproteobacteria bacterium]|nr:MAG: hypothetical protein COB36_12625 [Alphaproteobacteria bacterium]